MLLRLTISNLSPAEQEIAIAELIAAGFEGFEELENSLLAFISSEDYDPETLEQLSSRYHWELDIDTIAETNWNQLWESNFSPVRVGDFAAIRAAFHEPVPGTRHEVIITPKMSFGTGHHATTCMMIEHVSEMDLTGKIVFDFGTGTGILSILAEKCGAEEITAIDNDSWSIKNARENIEMNMCNRIKLLMMDQLPPEKKFDLILANINKHIILEHLPAMPAHLNKNGIILLSGLLVEDEKDIEIAAGKLPLKLVEKKTGRNWLSLRYSLV